MAKKGTGRRGKRRDNRHERRQQQHAGGGDFDAIVIPDGMDKFVPEAKRTYHIDVLPYVVGKVNKNADEGDEYFELSYPCYNNLGVDEKRFISIGELMGVKDPVLEHFARLRKDGADWDDMKDFKAKWRQLFLVFVHEEAEKGLQLFEAAYGTFGELLDEELAAEEEDYIDNFDDPDGGATLVVRFKAKSIGMANPWIKAAKLTFDEREDGFDADGDPKAAVEMLALAGEICLDELLKVPDYATLKAALDGEPSTEPLPEEEPDDANVDDGAEDDDDLQDAVDAAAAKARKAKARKAKADKAKADKAKAAAEEKAAAAKPKKKPPSAADLGITKGGEVEHDEHGTCTVLRIAKDGLTVVIMDEEDNVHKGVDPTDLEPIDDDADPTGGESDSPDESVAGAGSAKSSSKGKPSATSATKTSPSDDADGDEDWDEDWDED